MANLLVMMEFHRGTLLPVSLEALGQARRLGSALGMTVYALVPLPPEPVEDEDITVRCGRFGADKVLLLTGESLFLENEMRFEHYADALVAACTTLPPRLLLMGDTPAARDIVPRLASRLGAAYLPRGAALYESRRLILCDSTGRHLRIPLEATTSEGIPPLTIPVMLTVPAGRHDMAWGDQDAELMIVPPQDESAQTIPNLTISRHPRGGFTEEAVEPLPLASRVNYSGLEKEPKPSSSDAKVPPLFQICFGEKADRVDATLVPFSTWILEKDEPLGSNTSKRANYQLNLPDSDFLAAAAMLRELLSRTEKVEPIENPGDRPPQVRAIEGFADPADSQELTPTGEPWDDDFSGDTLSGDEASSARIRAVLDSEKTPLASQTSSSSVTPTLRPAMDGQAAPPRFTPLQVPPSAGSGAAMWEGFATLPEDDELPVDEEGNPVYDVAQADTAPVPVLSPSSKPKGGA